MLISDAAAAKAAKIGPFHSSAVSVDLEGPVHPQLLTSAGGGDLVVNLDHNDNYHDKDDNGQAHN